MPMSIWDRNIRETSRTSESELIIEAVQILRIDSGRMKQIREVWLMVPPSFLAAFSSKMISHLPLNTEEKPPNPSGSKYTTPRICSTSRKCVLLCRISSKISEKGQVLQPAANKSSSRILAAIQSAKKGHFWALWVSNPANLMQSTNRRTLWQGRLRDHLSWDSQSLQKNQSKITSRCQSVKGIVSANSTNHSLQATKASVIKVWIAPFSAIEYFRSRIQKVKLQIWSSINWKTESPNWRSSRRFTNCTIRFITTRLWGRVATLSTHSIT